MIRILLDAAILLHVGGAVLSFLAEARAWRRLAAAGAWILAGAFALEVAVLATLGAEGAALPLRSGAEYLLVLGCLVLGLHLVLVFGRRLSGVALVLPAASAAMVAVAPFVPAGGSAAPAFEKSGWFVFHTSAATAGMAALAVAFAMGVLFLVKDRALKAKRSSGTLDRLPSLETIDRVGFHALLWGFPLLTVGIATGLAFHAELHRAMWAWGAKEIFPILAWTIFAFLLTARLSHGVSGRRAALLSIAGFALGLLTFVGMAR